VASCTCPECLSIVNSIVQALQEITEVWRCHISGRTLRSDELSKVIELRAIV
jgi:hypothetical protein